MKNIVDIAIDLINKNGITTSNEIIKNIDFEGLKTTDSSKLESIIIADLMLDGRFLFINHKWDLKEKYTMKEIIKAQYKSLEQMDIIQAQQKEDEGTVEEIAIAVENKELDELEVDDIKAIDII